MNSVVTNREELSTAIEAIPFFKRHFLCVKNRKTLLLARAYSAVTVDLLYKDHPSTMEMWAKSDALWAKVYEIPYISFIKA